MNNQEGMKSIVPVMLPLRDESIVIIGGGKVATRRIHSLLQLDTTLFVISPEVTEAIIKWHGQNRLHWKAKCFESTDIKNAAIVIAATNDPKVNLQVYEAAKNSQLINLADRPDLSNFYFPAVFRRGKLIMSVSTSGASPGLTRQIKQGLAEIYTEDYGSYVDFLHKCRLAVKSAGLTYSVRNRILKELLQDRFRQMNDREREEAFKQMLEKEGGKG